MGHRSFRGGQEILLPEASDGLNRSISMWSLFRFEGGRPMVTQRDQSVIGAHRGLGDEGCTEERLLSG